MKKNYRQTLALAVLVLAIMPGWSLEWKKSLPGENRRSVFKSVDKISEDGWVNVLTEDFSKCIAGSEEKRDSVMLQDEVYEISEEFTHSTWWSGYGMYQAGGCLAVDAPGYGGFLNTPEIPMKGLVRVSARLKSLDYTCPVTIVLNRGGIGMPSQVALQETPRFFDFDGWETVNYTFYNPYDEDVFVQFNRVHNSVERKGFLIDDICIDVQPDYIPAVSEIACGEFVNDGFGVRWMNSPFTDTYLVSLYEETTVGDGDRILKENFDSWCVDENGKLTDIPEGWTIQLRDFHPSLVETDRGKSLVFGRHDEMIEIPSYGGRIHELKISFTNWLGDDPQAWGTQANVYGWNGCDWILITNFGTFGMEDGEVFDLDLGAWEDETNPYQSEPNSFRGLYSKVKIEMESCNYGACLFINDIEMTSFADTQIRPVFENEEVIGNQKYYSGLSADMRYYVGVKAKTDKFVSDEIVCEAWGIPTPVGLPAADVTPNSYTAQWEATPNAAAYLLTTFDVVKIDSDIKDYSHISENFSDVEVGTSDYDNPVKLGGFSEYFMLDEYTSVAGWYGAGIVAVDGHIGCAGCWYLPGMYGLVSPTLSLGGNDGRYKVHLKIYGYQGSSIVVFSSTQSVASEPFEKEGMQEITLELTGGTYHDTLGFYTSDGQQFFIEEVRVTQDLMAGELILTPLKEYEIADGSTSLANIPHEAQSEMLRAYDIMAARIEFTRYALSDYSVPVVVESTDGVEAIKDNISTVRIHTSGGCVIVDTAMPCHVAIFTADGRCVVSETGKCGRNYFPLNSGVYIVKVGDTNAKVVI